MPKWTPPDDQLLLALVRSPPALTWQELTRVYNDSRAEGAAERTFYALKTRFRTLVKQEEAGQSSASLGKQTAAEKGAPTPAISSKSAAYTKPQVNSKPADTTTEVDEISGSESDSMSDIVFVYQADPAQVTERPKLPKTSPAPNLTVTLKRASVKPELSPAITDHTPVPPSFDRSPTPPPPSAPPAKPATADGANTEELITLQERLVEEQKLLVEGLQHLIELKAAQRK